MGLFRRIKVSCREKYWTFRIEHTVCMGILDVETFKSWLHLLKLGTSEKT